jgi:hypothetical protein
VERLVARGHRKADILHEYTLDQLYAFFRASGENMKQDQLGLAVAVRVAVGANSREWKKYVDALSPPKPVRPAGRAEIEELKRVLHGRSGNRKNGR